MNKFFVIFICQIIIQAMAQGKEKTLVSVDFEIYGRVQGVFFRKHTQKQAKSLGLKGYCMNTEKGTVQGRMQGPPEKIEEMKRWLTTVGSPSSTIERAAFSNEVPVSVCRESDFIIKR